jgi:predicted Zn-ribbon and HTH transcriptional regulator
MPNVAQTNHHEAAVREHYESLGWSVIHGGAPDFLMSRQSPKSGFEEVMFVEAKGPHKTISPHQRKWLRVLHALGAHTELARTTTRGEVVSRPPVLLLNGHAYISPTPVVSIIPKAALNGLGGSVQCHKCGYKWWRGGTTAGQRATCPKCFNKTMVVVAGRNPFGGTRCPGCGYRWDRRKGVLSMATCPNCAHRFFTGQKKEKK